MQRQRYEKSIRNSIIWYIFCNFATDLSIKNEITVHIYDNTIKNSTNSDTFEAFCIVDGNGKIDGIEIKKGDSFIIPSSYGSYLIEGKLEMLKTTIK